MSFTGISTISVSKIYFSLEKEWLRLPLIFWPFKHWLPLRGLMSWCLLFINWERPGSPRGLQKMLSTTLFLQHVMIVKWYPVKLKKTSFLFQNLKVFKSYTISVQACYQLSSPPALNSSVDCSKSTSMQMTTAPGSTFITNMVMQRCRWIHSHKLIV